MKRILFVLVTALMALSTTFTVKAESTPNGLMVGASVRDITPREEWLPLPAVARTSMVGIVDHIHLRVIAFGNGGTPSLMVTFEMSNAPDPATFLTGLSEHTGIPVDAIFYGVTHCHSAPLTNIVPEIPSTKVYSDFVYEQLIDAADEAIARMEPATIGIGYTNSYINVNREGTFTRPDGTIYGTQGYNPTGNSDKTLAVVRINNLSGDPIAFVVNYAVHQTTMYANHYNEKGSAICSDIGGFVSKCLEEKFSGSVAAWLPGASGDQNPILSNEHFTPSPETGEQEVTFFRFAAYELTYFWGKIQFADVLTALSGIDSYSADAKVTYAFGGSSIPAGVEGDPPFDLTLKLLRIGDIAFVGDPGELFNSIGVYMKEHSLLKNTMIVNNTPTYTTQFRQPGGYMPDDNAMLNGGFHGDRKRYKPGTINEGFTKLMNTLIASTD